MWTPSPPHTRAWRIGCAMRWRPAPLEPTLSV
jgi:hypothetical protein